MDNLTDKDLEWLRRLVENWDRKLFKKYLWYRRKQIEETIWSLKLDWYKANGSTVLIRRREAFDEIYDFDEFIKWEINAKTMAQDHATFIDELVESMS